MKAKVLKDVTLTIKAGQTVEISEEQFKLAERLGFVEAAKEEKPKKKAAK